MVNKKTQNEFCISIVFMYTHTHTRCLELIKFKKNVHSFVESPPVLLDLDRSLFFLSRHQSLIKSQNSQARKVSIRANTFLKFYLILRSSLINLSKKTLSLKF